MERPGGSRHPGRCRSPRRTFLWRRSRPGRRPLRVRCVRDPLPVVQRPVSCHREVHPDCAINSPPETIAVSLIAGSLFHGQGNDTDADDAGLTISPDLSLPHAQAEEARWRAVSTSPSASDLPSHDVSLAISAYFGLLPLAIPTEPGRKASSASTSTKPALVRYPENSAAVLT